MTPIVLPKQIEALARVYNDFDRAFNRTQSRAAIDGGLLLLALLDELRGIRHSLQKQATRKPTKGGRDQ